MFNTFRLLSLLLLSTVCSILQAGNYRNPVIPGYHPDPSIIRVGGDYYAVNSSFQYFPGVPIFHSRDLIHWQQIGNVLDRTSQLPLKNASSWLGIYAPTLRYHDGVYYMITTNVGGGGNFMVTASDPRGPWSEPIWLEQQGIDPSLYFEDGKTYMVSNPDDCIFLCEIDPKTGKQLTQSQALWKGTGGRYPEGPHIYKKDGYYYLLISEGGTELAHGLTVARSRNIYGPYESCPQNPIMTNCNMAGARSQIQGTGHGDLVQAEDGQWWLMFLAYRNMGGSYHHLGRETCLAPVDWAEGEWPSVYSGQPIDTIMKVPANRLPASAFEGKGFDGSTSVSFDALKSIGSLPPAFVRIQNPIEENYQLIDGRLRLTAHGTLTENQQPTYLAVRQCSPMMVAETEIDLTTFRNKNTNSFTSTTYAGLSVYQIHDGHFDLTTDGNYVYVNCRLKTLQASCTYNNMESFVPSSAQRLKLRIESDETTYRFFMALDNGDYKEIAAQSSSLISTEVAGGFTGVTIGMMAEGEGYADFTRFSYQEK